MKYYDLLGEYDAETQAYSAFAVAGRASPYKCKLNGRLTGIRVVTNRTAATTLTSHVLIKLTCTDWSPNAVVVGGQGTGLQTAPAFPAPVIDYDFDQPVVNGHDITLEGQCVGASDVTNSVLVYGRFETGG